MRDSCADDRYFSECRFTRLRGTGRGEVRRPIALPAVVLLWAAASFALTGCGSWMPSTGLLGSAPPAAAAEPRPEGSLTVAASVALGPILGAPKPVSDRMVRMLDAA